MSELRTALLTKTAMYLDDRSGDGNIIVCTGGGFEHSFLRRRLGLSVECPMCGQIALSVDLIAEFYRRTREAQPGGGAMPLSDGSLSP